MDKTEYKIEFEQLIGQLEEISGLVDDVEGEKLSQKEARNMLDLLGNCINRISNISWNLSSIVYPKIELEYENLRN